MASGPEAFPKAHRLGSRPQFLSVQRSGRRQKCPDFVVLWRPNGLDASRLGVTVSKRVGNAVTRNRVKRHVREAFRRGREILPAGLDLVIVARPSAATLTGSVIASQLHRTFRRLPQNPPLG